MSEQIVKIGRIYENKNYYDEYTKNMKLLEQGYTIISSYSIGNNHQHQEYILQKPQTKCSIQRHVVRIGKSRRIKS